MARIVCRPQMAILPLVGVIPSFLLAVYSLTEPWARGRAMILFGVSRSPGAALLLAVTLAAMVAASVAVATRGRQFLLAGGVHLGTGIMMCGVAFAAFSMVRHAGVRLLGFVPLSSIHPGRGLRLFLLASLMVVILGMIEAATGYLARRAWKDRNIEPGARSGSHSVSAS